MKRSAQVALVLMGVTGTTATAAYMMPPPRDCGPRQAAPATTAAPAAVATPATTNLPPGVTPKQPIQGSCGRSGYRSYHSWGNWGWNSDRDRYVGSRRTSSSSTSAAFTNSGGRVGGTSSSSGSSSGAARGGFGSTGHGMSVAS